MIYAIIVLSIVVVFLSIQNYRQHKINQKVLASLEFIKKMEEQQDLFNKSQISFNGSLINRINKVDSENIWLYDKVKLLYGNNVG